MSTSDARHGGRAEGRDQVTTKKNHKIKPNIPKDEFQALKEMKKDNTRMVLTADKGVSMVVVDREDYTNKSEELLHQQNYKIFQTDPTNKYKNKLISLLKSIKAEGGMDDNTYRRPIPKGLYGLNTMGYPRCTNQGCH